MIQAQRFSAGYALTVNPEPAKWATGFPAEDASIYTSAVRFTDLRSFSDQVPALKRWPIFTPSAVADDGHLDLGVANQIRRRLNPKRFAIEAGN